MYLRPLLDSDIELVKTWLRKPHVSKWYYDFDAWIDEITNRETKYSFIHSYIVMENDVAIGFCQYYDYLCGGETWHGDYEIDHTFSIDYLIGEETYLGKRLSIEMLKLLEEEMSMHEDVKSIIVKPDPQNYISRKTLISVGYKYDDKLDIYTKLMTTLM